MRRGEGIPSAPPPDIPTSPEAPEQKIIPGRTLETAFDRPADPIITEEIGKQIGTQEMASYLLYGDRFSTREDDREYSAIRHLKETIEGAPRDLEAVRLRQEMLTNLVGNSAEKGGAAQQRLTRLYDQLIPIQHYTSDSFLPGLTEQTVHNNLAMINYYVDGKASEQIQQLKQLLSEVPTASAFLAELKSKVEELHTAHDTWVAWLQSSGWQEQFSLLSQVDPDGLVELPPGLKIANGAAYAHAADELNEHLRPLLAFNKVFRNFRECLDLSDMIIKRDLQKIDITDENVIEFGGVRHPLLEMEMGKDKVVPTDISITAEQPNVIVTGDNATGKSILVDEIELNALLTQATGYALAKSGRYSPRNKFSHLGALASDATETQYSRGQKEMQLVARTAESMGEKDMLVMDEFLTSTDSVGGAAILTAILEENAARGGMSLLTVHSRDLEPIQEQNLAPSIQFLRAKQGPGGKKTYQWEPGIGRADPIKLAEEAGLPSHIVSRARSILERLEKERRVNS